MLCMNIGARIHVHPHRNRDVPSHADLSCGSDRKREKATSFSHNVPAMTSALTTKDPRHNHPPVMPVGDVHNQQA
jgi:hypothetical protein